MRSCPCQMVNEDRGSSMIDELAFLLVLVREQNFSKAAEQCGGIQPTFSAGIKAAQGSAGCHAGAAYRALHRLHHRGRTRPRMGTRHCCRCARPASGLASPEAGSYRQAKNRGLPDNARHGVGPYDTLPPAIQTSSLRSSRAPRSISSRWWRISKATQASLTAITSPLAVCVWLHSILQYRLLTSEGSPRSDHDKVHWAAAGRTPRPAPSALIDTLPPGRACCPMTANPDIGNDVRCPAGLRSLCIERPAARSCA